MELSLAIEAGKNAKKNGYLSYYPRACTVLAEALENSWQVVAGRMYIAGPMTGYPELNFPAFHRVAAELRKQGFDVINPAELNPNPVDPWAKCLRRDIIELMRCESIFMLDGWQQSRGAGIEFYLANALSLKILYESPRATAVVSPMPGADSSSLGGANG